MAGYWINLSGIGYLSRSERLVMGDVITDGKVGKTLRTG